MENIVVTIGGGFRWSAVGGPMASTPATTYKTHLYNYTMELILALARRNVNFKKIIRCPFDSAIDSCAIYRMMGPLAALST